jgi:hypothetical protein
MVVAQLMMVMMVMELGPLASATWCLSAGTTFIITPAIFFLELASSSPS